MTRDSVVDPVGAVVVTGSGGTGCGRAIALRFAREFPTIICDINETGWRETVRLIEDGEAQLYARGHGKILAMNRALAAEMLVNRDGLDFGRDRERRIPGVLTRCNHRRLETRVRQAPLHCLRD